MSENNINTVQENFKRKKELILNDPEVISVFKSEGKQSILNILIREEKNIQDLKNALKMNPGSIKRHIDNLLELGLIVQTREDENSWGVKMKYYRAVAEKFTINYSWPES